MIVHLVVNPAAGRGQAAEWLDHVAARLRARSHLQVHVPDSAEASRALMVGLAARRVERVVVVGGDGIVHQAVNALAGSETALGIISAGTGNDAATGLGLPHGIEAAIDAATEAPRAIDLIESEAGLAVTVATVGFGVAVNQRADRMRFPRGGARYTVATMLELPRLKSHRLTMRIDGDEHEIDANMVAVANVDCFGGGMKIAPDADPTDGRLEVVVVGPVGPLTLASLLPTVFAGAHVRSRHVSLYSGSEVELVADGATAPLSVRADGEPFGTVPVRFRVRGRALLVAGADP